MPEPTKKTVKLDPPEIKALDQLKDGLKTSWGIKASREDIVAAMALGITVDQLFGMLLASQKGATSDGDPAEPEPDTG